MIKKLGLCNRAQNSDFASKILSAGAIFASIFVLSPELKAQTSEVKTICFRGSTVMVPLDIVAKYMAVPGTTEGACSAIQPVPTTLEFCYRGRTMEATIAIANRYIAAGATTGACNAPVISNLESVYIPGTKYSSCEVKPIRNLSCLRVFNLRKVNGIIVAAVGNPDVSALDAKNYEDLNAICKTTFEKSLADIGCNSDLTGTVPNPLKLTSCLVHESDPANPITGLSRVELIALMRAHNGTRESIRKFKSYGNYISGTFIENIEEILEVKPKTVPESQELDFVFTSIKRFGTYNLNNSDVGLEALKKSACEPFEVGQGPVWDNVNSIARRIVSPSVLREAFVNPDFDNRASPNFGIVATNQFFFNPDGSVSSIFYDIGKRHDKDGKIGIAEGYYEVVNGEFKLSPYIEANRPKTLDTKRIRLQLTPPAAL